MKRSQLGLIVLMLVLAAGCASKTGFNRERLRDQMGGQPRQTEKDIAKILSLNPQLPDPFKLGIYFTDTLGGRYYYRGRWRWTQEDKEKLNFLLAEFKKDNLISNVVPITTMLTTKRDLKSLRIAAARYGVDALLIISGASDVDRYTNNFGWTYFLILPMLFVPASEADSLFIARVSMWDVRNQFLYFTEEAESVKTQTRPNAFLNIRHLVEETKDEAFDRLLIKIKQGMAAWKAKNRK